MWLLLLLLPPPPPPPPPPPRSLKSSSTESIQLNLGLPFFLLPSGWEKLIFLQGTLSSILAVS